MPVYSYPIAFIASTISIPRSSSDADEDLGDVEKQ